MKRSFVILLLFQFACSGANDQNRERYKELAAHVTIIRDEWGVPHIYGKTDADAVFGLMYAQCEESFERVERNYIERFGRLSEIEGERFIYHDLQMRLIYDTAAAINDYKNSPSWLKKLLHAFADGVNYYILRHPEEPILLKKFEPWFPLMFTDGGYTATQTAGLSTADLEQLYNSTTTASNFQRRSSLPTTLTGSNAFAISPAKSATGNAFLYINPHVSFYFRNEMHMVSEEGLNAYGAVTWGQFFVFQGFNEHYGWMHTSSMADAADVYDEDIVKQTKELMYKYDDSLRKVTSKRVIIKYKNDDILHALAASVYYTHHGPVMAMQSGKWLTLKERNRSINGLIQSWQRMNATNLADFTQILARRGNNSTNTMYADNKGNIAYWHGNFIPKRNEKYDWSSPVDGSTSATEWKGIHDLKEIISVKNPSQGWLQNCNSSPFSAAGFKSIPKASFSAYMAPDEENFRSLFAIGELQTENRFTAEKLVALGYSNYLAAFDSLLPPLIKAYDELNPAHELKQELEEPIRLLRNWNKRSTISSVATTVAIEWALTLLQHSYQNPAEIPELPQPALYGWLAKNTAPLILLSLLKNVTNGLADYYGTWQMPWGEINRYQRTSGSIHQQFDDNAPSLPVGMASAIFGSLPSFETSWSGTKKGYGVAGNSFVAVVEFGPKIKAWSVVTGGQSFIPRSIHFNDQAEMYIDGKFKPVNFYKNEVLQHAKRTYYPGQQN